MKATFNSRPFGRALLATASVLAMAAPGVALAQAAADQGTALAEVVVTAQRREEGIQSVPVAITALTGQAIAEQHIQTVTDLYGRVPSLNVAPNGTQRDAEGVTIRGQGQTYLAPVGVVNYFAEVPLIQGSVIANQGGPGNFLDLETLQVLRGPQGTLFGRNTTGGALLFGPHRPTNDYEGYVQAQVGNYNDREFEAVANLPIVGDKLLVRVAGQKVDRDGYTKDVGNADATLSLPFQTPFFGPVVIPNSNLVLPGSSPNTGQLGLPGPNDARPSFAGRRYDDRHYWTARVGITFRPTDDIENYLVAYYTKAHNKGSGQVLTSVATNHPNLINLIGNAYGGPGVFDAVDSTVAQAVLARQQALGPRHVSLNTDQFYRLTTWAVVDTFRANLNDNLTFRNIIGWQQMTQNYAWDLDGSYLPVLSQVPAVITPGAIANLPQVGQLGSVGQVAKVTDNSLFTEEPQLQARYLDGKFVGVVGGFYSKQRPEGLQGIGSYNAATNGGGFFGVTTTSKAVYGQGTLDLGALTAGLDGLKFTGGVRKTWDRFDGFAYSPGFVLLPLSSAGESTQATTWTLGLDYQVTSRDLLYAKVQRGYKGGGFNISAVEPSGQTFGPEYVTSYEIGAKTDHHIGSVPVRFNIDVYDLEYKGIQRANGDNVSNGCTSAAPPARCAIVGNTTGLDQGAITYNAGSARVRGLELEAAARPIPGLELSGSYSYTDAKYTSYFLRIPADPVAGPQVGVKLTCDGPLPIPTSGPGVLANLTCSPFPFTPKNQVSLNARYAYDLPADKGQLVVNANYTHAGRAWTAPASVPAGEPGGYIDGYDLVNASLEWNGVLGTTVDARLFVTNLTNTTYRVSNSNGMDASLGYSTSIYNEPRMFGLSLRYRWGGE